MHITCNAPEASIERVHPSNEEGSITNPHRTAVGIYFLATHIQDLLRGTLSTIFKRAQPRTCKADFTVTHHYVFISPKKETPESRYEMSSPCSASVCSDDTSPATPSLLDRLIAESAHTWKPCGKPLVINVYGLLEERLLRALGLPEEAQRVAKRRLREEVEYVKGAKQSKSSDGTSDGEGEKRTKITFTDEQRKILEEHFGRSTCLTQETKDAVAAKTGLTHSQIVSWFHRKRKASRDVSAMKVRDDDTKIQEASTIDENVNPKDKNSQEEDKATNITGQGATAKDQDVDTN
ncbi:hypothetical protein QR680_004995 [Steinernema hermaphroditum]|uniref:Homeobox domain-containing protein n=1 Tax=Steinernema hermaphroditum TaxID=289476 RepID=A0AA39LUK3_9BILA|nr:hypothetical protein QR680_004995 [Steinernema hermaphroditum]